MEVRANKLYVRVVLIKKWFQHDLHSVHEKERLLARLPFYGALYYGVGE